MISKVRLRNWKSHMESEFDFSKGVNAIIGIMGSGKTSILQAISFGLYGTFPSHQARRVGLEDLIMKRPQEMEEAEIGLEIVLGDDTYSISRVLRKGKGTVKAELRKNGRLVEATPQGVTQEISRILDMDYDLFSKAVYSEQNSIDYFLRIPKGQRMEHIDRMLRLDRFEKAREGAVSLANRVRQEREDKLRMLADLRKEGLPERINGLREELEMLQEESERLEAAHEEAEKKFIGLESRLSGLESDEDELNETRRSLEGIDSGMKQIDESLSAKAGKEVPDRKSLETRLESLDTAVKQLEAGEEAARKSLEQARERIASLNAEIRIIGEDAEKIGKLGLRCPVCESEITSQKRRELLESRKMDEEKLRKRAVEEAGKAGNSRKNLDEMEGKLKKRMAEREELRSTIRDIDFIDGLLNRKAEYGKRRTRLAERTKRLEERLKGHDVRELREELRKVSAEERETKARIEASGQRINDREELLRELRSREELMVKYGEESMADQEIGDGLAGFTRAVKATQDQLREEFLKAVNGIMERIWSDLYPYRDFTGIRLAIDRDYVLQLRGRDGWTGVEGMASGGERSMAALCLRIAFSMAFIPNLRWLILDEPTHNLDSNAIEHFTGILGDRLAGFADQVFLITHDDRVSEGVGGNLYRLERDKARDGPTAISGLDAY